VHFPRLTSNFRDPYSASEIELVPLYHFSSFERMFPRTGNRHHCWLDTSNGRACIFHALPPTSETHIPRRR